MTYIFGILLILLLTNLGVSIAILLKKNKTENWDFNASQNWSNQIYDVGDFSSQNQTLTDSSGYYEASGINPEELKRKIDPESIRLNGVDSGSKHRPARNNDRQEPQENQQYYWNPIASK